MTGIVRVLTEQCQSCVFRPGNLMNLRPGRLAGMVATCKRDDTYIPCHETIDYSQGHDERTNVLGDGPAAICAGFAARYEPTILQLARRLGMVIDVPPPESWRR